MKLQKKRFSAAIAFALTLTIAATFITALPFAFGQERIVVTDSMINVYPFVVGINQKVLISGTVNPKPIGYNRDHSLSAKKIYNNFTFMITRPNKTVENVTMNSNDRAEAWFRYNCTQLGIYSVKLFWAGDAEHKSCITETNEILYWTVQEAAVPPPPKLTLEALIDVV